MTRSTSEQHQAFILSVRGTHSENGESVSAKEVARCRLFEGLWPVGMRTRFRLQIAEGAQFVVYAAGGDKNQMAFIASGRICSNTRPISAAPNRILRNKQWCADVSSLAYFFQCTGEMFDKPLSVHQLIPQLSFVQNQSKWGIHFLGGVIRIPLADYALIVSSA
jgi:hypothetical protein